MIRSNKIRKSARGEQCTLQIVGVCNGDPETVVFCHLPDESHGMGLKANDVCGCYGCSACHDALDRRVRCDELEANRYWYLFTAIKRTLVRLIELGVLKVA